MCGRSPREWIRVVSAGVAVALVLTVASARLTPAHAVYVDPPGVEISKEVIDFLEKNGVKLGNLSNFLNNVRAFLGERWRTFLPRLTQAGSYTGHPLWRTVIKYSRRIPPGAAGFVSAELLLGAVAAVEVAQFFYAAGYRCGTSILTTMDVDGVMANQEAFNSVMDTFNDALASGRWRLKPGWTGRDAMLQVLINMKTNRCPYFADLIEPATAATFPCPRAGSPARAQILRDENFRKYQVLRQQAGPSDPRTQEALALYQCYRAQAGP